ncbi:MAG TPA: c-type cytochrome [Gemmatimonadales bacterium]|jgi:thiosulfate dehydrogenase|nr:c-type cytochrome [Gemmatimonadales bacterium]
MPRFLSLVWLSLAALACGQGAPALPATGRGPADSLMPSGPLGAAIRRGRALLVATHDSLPAHVGNRLRCVSCHLDEGRRPTGSWVGTYAKYPQYRARSATVETIEYRVNDCFRRSMNGTPLAADSPEMRDIVAYLWFLARDVPIAPPRGANPLARWAGFHADTGRGAALYQASCAKCHGADGQGTVGAPPTWGAGSYNIGAGMTRVRTAAAFIRDNMPFDQPGTLSDQQAFDVAAFVDAQPRPDYPDKVRDWPNGDAPPDVAYPTRAAERRAAPVPGTRPAP